MKIWRNIKLIIICINFLGNFEEFLILWNKKEHIHTNFLFFCGFFHFFSFVFTLFVLCWSFISRFSFWLPSLWICWWIWESRKFSLLSFGYVIICTQWNKEKKVQRVYGCKNKMSVSFRKIILKISFHSKDRKLENFFTVSSIIKKLFIKTKSAQIYFCHQLRTCKSP